MPDGRAIIALYNMQQRRTVYLRHPEFQSLNIPTKEEPTRQLDELALLHTL